MTITDLMNKAAEFYRAGDLDGFKKVMTEKTKERWWFKKNSIFRKFYNFLQKILQGGKLENEI